MSEELWPHAALGELALEIKDGSHGTHKRVVNGVPFLSAKNVAESGRLVWGDADDRVSEDDYSAICSSFTPRQQDLLLTIVGTLGRRAVFDGSRVAFQRSVAFIRADPRKILPRYLFHAIGSHDFYCQLVRRSNATAQAGLYLGQLAKTTIPTPPQPDEASDQSRIAAVLDTVDDAIAKTEAVIAKLRHVRAGLLHDLLTRGLDHNGQLRDPVAHPEQFKDSPLGRIPKEWMVESIEQLLAPVPHAMRSGPFGSSLLKQELRSSGVPLLGIDNVHVERFEATYTRFVGEDKFQELKQYSVRPLDIMITIMGTVGRCCVVPVGIGTAISSKHVWTMTLNQHRYSPHLACWQLNHAEWALRQLRVDEQGGVMTAIRSDTLRRLRLPVPTRTEMNTIERILFAHTNGIEAEQTELAKLRQLKSGLMTDLLSGRVRVAANGCGPQSSAEHFVG